MKNPTVNSVRLPLPRWFSFLALIIASAMLRFSLGPPLIPAFTWLFPVFMMMWVRSNKASWGLLLGWILTILAVAIIALPAAGAWGGTLICWMVAGVAGSLLFLPFAVDRFVSHRLSGIFSTLVFPLSWVTVEFLRSFSPYFGTTFALAVTQFDSPLITQISSVTGIWAITFLMVWLAPVVCLALENRFEWSRVARPVSLFLVVLIAVLCFGGIRLGLDRPASSTVRIAGVTASSRDGTLTGSWSQPPLGRGLPTGSEGGGRQGVVHRPRAGGSGQNASDKVRPPGRAGRDRGNDDSYTRGGALLPRARCTLLATTRADGGTVPRTSAAEVEQEPLALTTGGSFVHRACHRQTRGGRICTGLERQYNK
jgi:hypothetical protein